MIKYVTLGVGIDFYQDPQSFKSIIENQVQAFEETPQILADITNSVLVEVTEQDYLDYIALNPNSNNTITAKNDLVSFEKRQVFNPDGTPQLFDGDEVYCYLWRESGTFVANTYLITDEVGRLIDAKLFSSIGGGATSAVALGSSTSNVQVSSGGNLSLVLGESLADPYLIAYFTKAQAVPLP